MPETKLERFRWALKAIHEFESTGDQADDVETMRDLAANALEDAEELVGVEQRIADLEAVIQAMQRSYNPDMGPFDIDAAIEASRPPAIRTT